MAKRKVKTPRFKIGDIVAGRLIQSVEISYHTTASFLYGYIYVGESLEDGLLFCDENTMLKKYYNY